jgi:hypothetical protein
MCAVRGDRERGDRLVMREAPPGDTHGAHAEVRAQRVQQRDIPGRDRYLEDEAQAVGAVATKRSFRRVT